MNVTFTSPGAVIALFIFAGFVFGIATGSVAKARGRDQTTWIALGFFLGFLALIVVAVLPEGDIGRKRCPDCVSRVPDAANVCRYCNYRFAGPA